LTRRSRAISFGSSAASVLAGALCAALIGGPAGSILAIVLIGLGLIAVLSLVFLEVGLSEDRVRAREAERQRSGSRPEAGRSDRALPPPPARLQRMRGRRRRLR